MAQAVHVAVFHEAFAGVDHEDAAAGGGVLFVKDDDAGRDAGAVEQVGRQADDALDIAPANDVLAYLGLDVAAKEHAVGQDDRTFAGALHRFQDVQQEGVVAILGRRNAVLEAAIQIVGRIEAVAPGLGGKREIGHHEVEGLEAAVRADPMRAGERVALPDLRRRVVVQDHVHLGQGGGGVVHLLAVDRHTRGRFVGHLQQQRAGTARGIVCRLILTPGLGDANDLGDDAGHLRRREELALALARLRREVAHEVLIRIAQEIVALGAVLAEVEAGVLEDRHQVGEAIHHLFAAAQLVRVVEIGDVDRTLEVVGLGQPGDDLVDLVADLLVPLERDHVGKAAAGWNLDQRIGLAGISVRDVFDEEQDEDVILVLRSVHPAAQFVAAFPEGAVEF